MSYSERAYFPDAEGRRDACAHCAARDEFNRLARIAADARRAFAERRRYAR